MGAEGREADESGGNDGKEEEEESKDKKGREVVVFVSRRLLPVFRCKLELETVLL